MNNDALKTYIQNFIHSWGLPKTNNTTLWLTGNFTRFFYYCIQYNPNFSLKQFMDMVIESLENSTTILLPVFNWGFCKGEAFDIINSPSQTGSLGTFALNYYGFERTKHPIYSFAVYGPNKNAFLDLENKNSFGPHSPFDLMCQQNGVMVVVDLPLQKSFTFVHHAEELYNAPYRHQKTFIADYIDLNGTVHTKKPYSMFVRNLQDNVQTFLWPLESLLPSEGAMKLNLYEGIEIRTIDLRKSLEILKKDILENSGVSLHQKGDV